MTLDCCYKGPAAVSIKRQTLFITATAGLRLSAIERHFYARQHAKCAAEARQLAGWGPILTAAGRAGTTDGIILEDGPLPGAGVASGPPLLESVDLDRPLTVREQRKLLVPLQRLRQACDHPQARTLRDIRDCTHECMNRFTIIFMILNTTCE